MLRAFVFGAALLAVPAQAATLGLTTDDPFLVGGSSFAGWDGAIASLHEAGGPIAVSDLGWTGLSSATSGLDAYGLGFGFRVNPDDTVSSIGLHMNNQTSSSEPLRSYTLGGFGFTDYRLEFLLQGVVSDEPWIGDTVLVTLTLGLSDGDIFASARDTYFGDGVYAALLADLGPGEFGSMSAGYDTDFTFANVISAPIPASLPLLLSGLALLGFMRRPTYLYGRLHRSSSSLSLSSA